MSNLSLRFYLVASLVFVSKLSIASELSSSLGYRYGEFSKSKYEARTFLRTEYSGRSQDYTNEYRIKFRLSHQDIGGQSEVENEIRPEEVWVSKAIAASRFSFGLQRVAWGETIAIPILDIVNPNDYDQFFLSDPKNSKLPSWMIQYELVTSLLDLQLIYSPRYSQESLERSAHSDNQEIPEAEYGFRFSPKIFSSINWNIYTYYHRTRQLIIEIDPNSGVVVNKPDLFENSYAQSVSYAGNSWVFRYDHIYSPEFYLNGELDPITQIRNSYSFGLDYSSVSSGSIGVQYSGGDIISPLGSVISGSQDGIVFIHANRNFWQERLSIQAWLGYLPEADSKWYKLDVDFRLVEQLKIRLVYDQFEGIDTLTADQDSVVNLFTELAVFF